MSNFPKERLESQQAYDWMDKLRKKRERDPDEEYEREREKEAENEG